MNEACDAEELARRLRGGEPAIFPTDTLPALASRPEHASQLWALKQRPQSKPVILMAATAAELWDWLGLEPLPAWQAMADRHWPGALTLVLPCRSPQLQRLHPGGKSLGVRIPACAMALELLQRSGPLATTSANRSGEPPCLNPDEAADRFPQVPQLGPQPWPPLSGQASTVLAWNGAGGWQVLRHGAMVPDSTGPMP